jgi:hypothetical protein
MGRKKLEVSIRNSLFEEFVPQSGSLFRLSGGAGGCNTTVKDEICCKDFVWT